MGKPMATLSSVGANSRRMRGRYGGNTVFTEQTKESINFYNYFEEIPLSKRLCHKEAVFQRGKLRLSPIRETKTR